MSEIRVNEAAMQSFSDNVSRASDTLNAEFDRAQTSYQSVKRKYDGMESELEEKIQAYRRRIEQAERQIEVSQAIIDRLSNDSEEGNSHAAEIEEESRKIRLAEQELQEYQSKYNKASELESKISALWDEKGRPVEAKIENAEEAFNSFRSSSETCSEAISDYLDQVQSIRNTVREPSGTGISGISAGTGGSGSYGNAGSPGTGGSGVSGLGSIGSAAGIGDTTGASGTSAGGPGAAGSGAAGSGSTGTVGSGILKTAAAVGAAGIAAAAVHSAVTGGSGSSGHTGGSGLTAGAGSSVSGDTGRAAGADTVPTGADSASGGNSGSIAAAGKGGSSRMKAVSRDENGRKSVKVSIGDSEKTYPCTQSGIAKAYRDAKRSGDPEMIERTYAMYEVETFRQSLELGSGSPLKTQMGGYHGDVRKSDPAHYESHHIPANSAQDTRADDLPTISITHEDHKTTSTYGGRQRSVYQSVFPDVKRNTLTYLNEEKERLDEGSSGYVDLMKNEVYDLISVVGHDYDGGLDQYFDAVIDLIASRGIPKSKR